MSISDIVDVNITRETTPVSRTGFGVMMILGTNKIFNDRIKFYSSLDEITSDGFNTTSPEYLAAQSALAQDPRPEQIAIGRRAVDSVDITIDEANDGEDYTTTINGTDFTYTAGSGDDDAAIAGELVTLINAGSEPVTATDNNDGTFTIDADTPGNAYTVALEGDLSLDNLQPSESIADDLDAIAKENDDFYGIVFTGRTQSDVEDVAAWTENNKKLFGTASSDQDILDDQVDSDIASVLKDNTYARSFVLYHKDAATSYPEAAWFGNRLPSSPGSSTWAYKTLVDVVSSNVTTDQRNNAFAKNANTYEKRAEVNITKDGTVAEGDFIDVIRGVDWLEARLTERIYNLVTTKEKIPYTNAGVAAVEEQVRAQLDQAIEQNVLAADPEPTISVPNVRDVAASDRANRHLPDVNFTAVLAGAIHSVQINGVVSI